MKKPTVNELGDRAFIAGFAVAMGFLIRHVDQPSVAVDMAQSHGFDVNTFDRVDSHDRTPIRKAFKDCGAGRKA